MATLNVTDGFNCCILAQKNQQNINLRDEITAIRNRFHLTIKSDIKPRKKQKQYR